MFQRKISPKSVRRALDSGQAIEDYSAEMPDPSRLILGFLGKQPFHVVTSENPRATTIITVYLPDPDRWKKGFMKRS